MANLTFILEESRYKVISNDVNTGWDVYYLTPSDIIETYENEEGDSIILVLSGGDRWALTLGSSTKGWVVDSVLGEVPPTISDLSIAVFNLRIKRVILLSKGVNVNTESATNQLDLGDYKWVAMYVESNGSKSNYVVTLQISPNYGETWFDTDTIVTRGGFIQDQLYSTTSVRAKITTVEGTASTADITLIAK